MANSATTQKSPAKSRAKSVPNTRAKRPAKPTSKSAAKSSANGKSNTAAALDMNIQMIPLDQLALSENNVRKVSASDQENAELLASIRANGIKQNLVGYFDGETFFVDAGGRRLAALRQLAEEGVIANDVAIPCKVEDEDQSTLTSTTENAIRAAMHPADEFAAFKDLIDEGRSEADIALKFGITEDKVRRRLKLARVAPAIVEAFRENILTLECMMAFTVNDDHKRQLAYWDGVKDQNYFNAHQIRSAMTEETMSANSKLASFVTIETYEAAGGAVLKDMFFDRASTYLQDPALVTKLAVEKLQALADQHLKSNGGVWKWAEAHLETDHGAFRSFGRIYPTGQNPDEAIEAEATKLEERKADMNENIETWTDEMTEEEDKIDERLEEIETIRDTYDVYAEQDMAVAGIIVTLDYHGDLQFHRGLVRPEDIPAPADVNSSDDEVIDGDEEQSTGPNVSAPLSSQAAPKSDADDKLQEAKGLSQALTSELTASRHQILQAHLAADFDVAFDALIYSLSVKAFGHNYGKAPLDVRMETPYFSSGSSHMEGSVAERMMEGLKNILVLDWMELEAPEDFKALSALDPEDKQNIFAFLVADGLKAQLGNVHRPNEVIEHLGERMDVSVTECWRPTASNYWNRVTKDHAVGIARELIGNDFADLRNGERKMDLAKAMESAFAETASETEGFTPSVAANTSCWLPEGMAFREPLSEEFVAEANEAASKSDADASADTSSEATETILPAFLDGSDGEACANSASA